MPSSPFKNIIKTINTDKNFNVESFLSNEFGSLWGLFYDYIQKLATTPTKDSLFKRNKFSDLKGIYNALQKILPETKGFHYKDEFLFLINKVFANFFHPDTSAPIRTQMMEFFFTIISKLPQEKIDILSGALNLIVPYSRFSSTDNGVKKMKSYLIETIQPVPIIDPSAPAGTQDDCITDLKRFLQFIKENWTNSSINTIRIINEYVLDVIFKGVLPEYVSSPNSQGFSSLPPYNIYHTVLEFFSSIITSMFNFTDFLSYGRNSRLMLGIVGLSENYKSNIDYLTAIEILTNIYTSNNYIEIIQSDESGNFFYEICTVYIKIVSSVLNEMKPESNLTATDKFIQISYLFISNYISSTTMSLGDNKAIEIIYKLFLDNTKYMKSLALILILILNHFISNQNWSEAIWSKLSYLIVSNDTLSAMAAHYAQYLAVYSFPYEFEINFEKAKGVCMNHQRRKQRTKQATPHDFIAENIEQIVKFPADFVHQNIKAYYEPFSKYDDLISKIPIVPLTFQDKEIIRSIIISFLDIFSNVLIADEFSQPQQNPNVFINILNYLLEALFNESFEAILTIRSMLMYSDSLSELIPKEFLSFIEKISEFTTKIDEKDITKESFHFYLIQLVAYLYIYNYKITHTSNSYQQFAEFLISAKKKSFSNNIINLINNLISLLSIYYGGYPFPQTNSFPTHIQPTVNKNSNNVKPELFSTLETVIHPYYNDNNEVEVAFQGNSGNFVWKFKEIDDLLYQEQEQLTINIPITDDKDYTLIQSDEEKEYVNVFNQLLEDYKQEFDDQSFEMDIFPLDNEQLNANIQQIESFENIINNQNDNKISFPYPVIGATSPLAGALTACGRYPLGHPENFQRVDSQYIDNIEKIQKQNHRLGIKIGVVFIGPNVDNQNQILATTFEETSPHFREFVTGLGWPIELKSHVGYDGGLDLQRNGKTSIYYANFTDEIMFHIAPLLPTDPKDDQQIYKKRHIGNDHIHIVWCEQGRDYDITTITSQFNQAHIVIYPLQTGLFHVDIHWRKDLGWFGPLRYSIVVNKTVLPSLIRETAVSAMKSFYYSQEVTKYASPQNEIAKTLLTVIPKTDKKKEKKDATDKGVMESLEMLMRIAQPIQ
ncbi:Rap/ran-GAP family protein [Histomonas meleagridis]|uniref:Rap/ran-GAP family protein n=1 Tax=Histomonas meleagridis TaxID=135588 RepID=UPI00355A1729|nr:Rap/ran-GAP family protein [Histomonas meleagridis]KAH0805969.1 Rap/ran-GAP family protein [Histomonas meleagridis]